MVKKALNPKLRNFILNNGRRGSYLEAIKELYKMGFSLEEISQIKEDDIIMRKLSNECKRKHLLKKDRIKKNY